MSSERLRILEMLAQKKIDVEEADKLLDALGTSPRTISAVIAPVKPRFLRVVVQDGEDNVNVRVPLQLLRAGISLASVIPESIRDEVNEALGEEGINFDLSNVKPENVEELISAFADFSVEVNDPGGGKVRVFCE